MKPKSTPLYSEHNADGGTGGGAAPTPTPPAALDAAQKPGIIEQVVSGLRSRQALTSEIAQLRQELATAHAENQTISAEVDRLTIDNAEHTANMQALTAALDAAQADQRSSNEIAADLLRAKGVSPTTLPAASNSMQPTVADLEDQLSKTSDPKERYRITNKIMALEATAI